jgi:uncharacterized membrane protein
MDFAHIHIVLTHFPIIGTLFGAGILLYGLISRDEISKKTAYVIFILVALVSIPVFFSGGEAEEVVEHLPGISENSIEQHEELAEAVIWLMALLGILSVIGFLFSRSKKAATGILHSVILIVSLVTFGFFARVGNLGGQIRHTEIRSGNQDLKSQGGKEDTYKYEKGERERDDD